MFIIFSTTRNGFDILCVKLWTFFCKFYVLSIRPSCCSMFPIKTCSKLVPSIGVPVSIYSRDAFDPLKCKTRFLFCDCLSLMFVDTPLSALQYFSSLTLLPLLSSWPRHCLHLKVFQVCRFLLPLSLLK